MNVKNKFLKSLCNKFDFKSNFLFDDLSSYDIKLIQSSMENVAFRKNDLLFYEGGIPTGVYFIKKGRAKKYKSSFGGENQIFYIYNKGDLLGYHALLCNERYEDGCEAIDDCEVGFISSERFSYLMNTISTLRYNVIKNISHEFGVMANMLALLAQQSQIVRLSTFILVLSNRFAQNSKSKLSLDLSRDDLANVIGTSREGLSRSLKELKDEGIVVVENKTIVIKDLDKLVYVIKNK